MESTGSSRDSHTPAPNGHTDGANIKISGAAALKPTEHIVEALAGKKKSRFWCYAVEEVPLPVPEVAAAPPSSDYEMSESSIGPSTADGPLDDVTMNDADPSSSTEYGTSNGSYHKSGSIERSVSPTSSMDES